MPFTFKDIACGGVVPALVTACIMLIVRHYVGSYNRDRHLASVATVVGFLFGYGLLALAPWSPTAHWHWLPFTFILAAVVGPISCAEGVTVVERLILFALVALGAGCLIVPEWDDLTPSRNAHLTAFASYVVVLSTLLAPLTKRLTGPLLPALLGATVTAAAVVLALSGSLRFAQIALAMAAALFGIVIVAAVRRDESQLTGIALLFSVASVGCLLIGRVNSFSNVPLASYLMIPAAPLFAWCGCVAPLAQYSGVKRMLAIVTVPLAILAAAVLIAAVTELGAEAAY